MVANMAARQTQLREIYPFTPSWDIVTDASGTDMVGVYRSPTGQWFLWCSPLLTKTQGRLVSKFVPHGYITFNTLELSALLAHFHLLAPHVAPLSHIHTVADNTAAQGWSNRDIVLTSSSLGTIL